MRKSIITSVLASVLLSGCGSGGSDRSDSGSGSSSTPTTKYTLQFVQLVERAENSGVANCTLFDVDGQTAGKETYARLAPKVTVKTYDADGNFVKDLSNSVSSVGVLNITAGDVVDGGYISIIDSPSDSSTDYEVLSIQKVLLGDLMIAVERNQGINSSCYKETSVTMKTGFSSVTPNGIPSSTWTYDSSQSEIAADAYTSQKVSAFSDESVLVRAYDGILSNILVDYVFVSTLTKDKNIDATYLSGVDLGSHDWTISLLDDELTKLSVRLNQGDYSYPWIDAKFVPATGVTTKFTYVDTEISWNYRAEGTTDSNWHFRHNDELLPAPLDVNLPTELTLTNGLPSIDNFIFKANGIDSTLARLQRSEYKVHNGDYSRKLNHIIYSEVAAGDDSVVIPKLGLIDLDPIGLGSDALGMSVLSTDKLTADLRTLFMHDHMSSDLVSVVLPPKDIVKNNKTKYRGSYTLLNR